MIQDVLNRRALTAMIGILANTALTVEAAGPGSAAVEIVVGANHLSKSKDITDHADARQSGSLASWAVKAGKTPTTDMEVVVSGTHSYTIGSDLTIPQNLTVRVQRGTILDVRDGATLTINGQIAAGPWRIFSKTGSFDGDINADFVRPQWWGADTAALQAAVKFKRVHLGRGQFTIDAPILIGSDTHITGEPGCLITSTREGLNLNEGFFTNVPPGRDINYLPAKNVTIDGVKFKNTTAIGIYGLKLAVWEELNENIRFINCEAVGCCLVNVNNVRNVLIKNNNCHSSTLALKPFEHIAGDFEKYNNHRGIQLGSGVIEDVIISHNRILGPRCHAICVVSEEVYNRTYEDRDPDQDFPGKRILIAGNHISAPPNPFTAAGIFVGYVQECRIIGNHVQSVGDTAIDFEGSRNCIADSNVIVNGGKCLAMWGNNKNITFSNNVVYLTEYRYNKDSPFFKNSYSNGYNPPIIDLRSTEIFVTGNTFCALVKRYERPWTAAIVPGTAKRLYIRNNNFVNARFQAHFCDDLETIEVTGNSFYNELEETGTVVDLAISERNKTERQPTKNFIISDNRFRSVNDAGTSSSIHVATVGGLEGTAPYCDLNVVIDSNIIERETTQGTKAIFFEHNYDWGHADDMKINCIIRNNITNGDIGIEIPEARRKAVNLVVEGNTKLTPTGPGRAE